jgi:hypothetical protein
MGRAHTELQGVTELQQWAERVCAIDIVIDDPDKERIEKLYHVTMKIGDPFEMKTGPMQGQGRCIRRKLTPREGVLFTILYSDGKIREWEWFD